MRALKIAGMALNGLRRSPLRVTLTTLGVTFATGALVTMIALALGVQRQVETPFRALSLLNNIEVKPAEPDAAAKPPPLNEAALARLEKLPGVAMAYPDSHVKGIKIHYRDKEAIAIGLAMPREATLLGVADEILVAGRLFEDDIQPEAILGVQLAESLGFSSPQEALGKEITVEAAGLMPEGGSEFSFRRKVLTVKIVGIYHAPTQLRMMSESAQKGIFLPIALMKEIPEMYLESALNQLKAGGNPAAASYASVTVRVRDPAYLDEVEAAIGRMGYRTQAMLGKLQGMRRFFLAIQLLLTVVGSIALAIAALGIVNTLLMAVLERYQEIGLCKAIGASDGDLFVLFLTEAGIIGFLGGLTGIALGWLMSWGMEYAASVYANRQDITGRLDLFAFPLWLLAATVAFAVVVSVVAGIYPALRAARVDPIRALRSH
jgi:putative ABC transport system permease protein